MVEEILLLLVVQEEVVLRQYKLVQVVTHQALLQVKETMVELVLIMVYLLVAEGEMLEEVVVLVLLVVMVILMVVVLVVLVGQVQLLQ